MQLTRPISVFKLGRVVAMVPRKLQPHIGTSKSNFPEISMFVVTAVRPSNFRLLDKSK
jgi:hypothetical protein